MIFLKKNNKKYSIFIGLLDICGLYGSLNRGLNEIGHKSYILHMGEEKSGYIDYQKMPIPLRFFYFTHKLIKKTIAEKSNKFKILFYTYLNLFSLFLLIAWIVIKIDIILLKSGEGFSTSLFDLKIFKFFKKKIVFWFHGSDERVEYFRSGIYDKNRFDGKMLYRRTLELKKKINARAEFADLIIGNPLSGHLHNKPILIYNIIGVPTDKLKIRHKKIQKRKKVIQILHAPSDPLLKGSKIIRQQIAILKAKGLKFDYKEITNSSNSKVLKELDKCDIFIDELTSDVYGATASTEAAMMGKPSIVCGYAKEEMDRLVPKEYRMPTNYVQPENLGEMIEKLVTNTKLRRESGLKMKKFFKNNSNSSKAAERFIKVVKGEYDNLLVQPEDIRYFWGTGANKKTILKRIKSVIKEKGISGLCLDDKPLLLKSLLAFLSKAN